MSGSERSRLSYPVEAGHANSASQKLKKEMGEGALNSTSTKGSHCLRPKLNFPSKCNNKTWRTSSVCLKQCSTFNKCSMNGG